MAMSDLYTKPSCTCGRESPGVKSLLSIGLFFCFLTTTESDNEELVW